MCDGSSGVSQQQIDMFRFWSRELRNDSFDLKRFLSRN